MVLALNGKATKAAGLPGLEGLGASLRSLLMGVMSARRTIRGRLLQPLRDEVEGLRQDIEGAVAEAGQLLERASGLASDAQASVFGLADALAASVATACEEAGCQEEQTVRPLGVPLWASREELLAAFDAREAEAAERIALKAEEARLEALAVEREHEARHATAVAPITGERILAGLAAKAVHEDEQAARRVLAEALAEQQIAEAAKEVEDGLGQPAAPGWSGPDPKSPLEATARQFGTNHESAGAVADADARDARHPRPKPKKQPRKGGK